MARQSRRCRLRGIEEEPRTGAQGKFEENLAQGHGGTEKKKTMEEGKEDIQYDLNIFLDSDILISALNNPDFKFPDKANYFISKKSLYEHTYNLKNKLTDKFFLLKSIRKHNDRNQIADIAEKMAHDIVVSAYMTYHAKIIKPGNRPLVNII